MLGYPSSRGYYTALASAAVLSTTAIFIKVLTHEHTLAPLVLALWRNVFTVLAVGVALRILAPRLLHLESTHWPYILVHGLILALFNALWTLSVSYNGAAVATVLVYSSAAFAAVLGLFWLQEELHLAKVLSILLSLGGCMLVARVSSLSSLYTNRIGLLLGVLSGLCYALYSIGGRVASKRQINPWTTLLYTFAAAALWLLILNQLPSLAQWGAGGVLPELLWASGSRVGWLLLLALAAGPTVLGFGLYNVSLSLLPASTVNLVAVVEPVFTFAVAALFLGESLEPMQLCGGAVVIAAILLLNRAETHIPKQARSVV